MPGEFLIYLVAAPAQGRALIVSLAQDGGGRTEVIPLPHLSTRNIEVWLMRRNDRGQVLGGMQFALDQRGVALLQEGIRQAELLEQGQPLLLPFHQAVELLPETMGTLRQALCWMGECWVAEAEVLSGEGVQHQQAAALLRRRLEVPLGALLEQGHLENELSWFLYEAELEWLLPHLSERIMVPLRRGLDDLGLRGSNQPITLFPLGRLSQLPLQRALVPDPQSGTMIPFEETCRLTLIAHLSPPFPHAVEGSSWGA